MRRCHSIFSLTLSVLSLSFISTALSCSLFSCCSFLCRSTSLPISDALKESARRQVSDNKTRGRIELRGGSAIMRSKEITVDRETSLAPSSEVTKWGNKEIDALTKDLGRGAQPQSSSDFYGQKSLREYEYERQYKYYAIDVLKDYLFAVLYSGMVLVTFLGILGHMTFSPLLDHNHS